MKDVTIYKGNYTLTEQIAAGGFAQVYRGVHVNDPEKVVAVKVNKVDDDPIYQKSLMQEARIISKLTHNAIVKIEPIPRDGRADLYYAKASELTGSPYFFVMEYLGGGTLDQYMEQVGTLEVDEASAIALEIARGLDHMHRVGYYHNDLKLENVVFRKAITKGTPFTPVLIDFGIATKLRLQKNTGSIYIMSPERLAHTVASDDLNESGVDLMKVDVWGIGILLYRMLSGRLPFTAKGQERLTKRIREDQPPELKENGSHRIPPEMNRLVIDGCLEKNPDNRISILELGRELNRFGANVVARTLAGHKSLLKFKFFT